MARGKAKKIKKVKKPKPKQVPKPPKESGYKPTDEGEWS